MSTSPNSDMETTNIGSTKIVYMILNAKEKGEVQPIKADQITHQMPTIDPKIEYNKVTLDGNVQSNGAITKNVEAKEIRYQKAKMGLDKNSEKKNKNSEDFEK